MTFNVQLISYFILLHVNLLHKCDNKPQNVCLVVFPIFGIKYVTYIIIAIDYMLFSSAFY